MQSPSSCPVSSSAKIQLSGFLPQECEFGHKFTVISLKLKRRQAEEDSLGCIQECSVRNINPLEGREELHPGSLWELDLPILEHLLSISIQPKLMWLRITTLKALLLFKWNKSPSVKSVQIRSPDPGVLEMFGFRCEILNLRKLSDKEPGGFVCLLPQSWPTEVPRCPAALRSLCGAGEGDGSAPHSSLTPCWWHKWRVESEKMCGLS